MWRRAWPEVDLNLIRSIWNFAGLITMIVLTRILSFSFIWANLWKKSFLRHTRLNSWDTMSRVILTNFAPSPSQYLRRSQFTVFMSKLVAILLETSSVWTLKAAIIHDAVRRGDTKVNKLQTSHTQKANLPRARGKFSPPGPLTGAGSFNLSGRVL